jgi:multiple sugar transport system ATP-binding protein
VAGSFLQIEGLSKRFGAAEALADVSLSVEQDELLVVLGPTGAGKTTLLRTIAGLESPEAGSIRMGGRDVTNLPPAERDVALVFQNFSLYPNWTVRRNLEFPLKAPCRRAPRAEVDRRVQWAAELLRIEHLLDRKSQQLSGGEMQRLAIGRAIVRRPGIFLMDEPLTNLDAKLREQLRVELVCLRRELGTPMVFVTHDQAEALSMGQRVVVLSEGRVLQTAPPEEVYRRPASPVVARQLGQPAINLVEVTRRDGRWMTPGGVALAEAPASGPGRRLLGVRPEDIRPEGGAAPATVRVVERMGPVNILLADWAGWEIHLIVPPDSPAAPGGEIHPRIEEGRAVFWDADGEF